MRLGSGGAVMQPPLPVERLAHDLVRLSCCGVQPSSARMRSLAATMAAGSPGRRADLRTGKIDARDPFHDVDHLVHGIAVPIADIAGEIAAAGAQIIQRVEMGVERDP